MARQLSERLQERMPGLQVLLLVGTEQEQWDTRQLVCQKLDQSQGWPIGPLEVVYDQKMGGAAIRCAAKKSGDVVEETKALLLGPCGWQLREFGKLFTHTGDDSRDIDRSASHLLAQLVGFAGRHQNT